MAEIEEKELDRLLMRQLEQVERTRDIMRRIAAVASRLIGPRPTALADEARKEPSSVLETLMDRVLDHARLNDQMHETIGTLEEAGVTEATPMSIGQPLASRTG